jgi:hypothetical protein
MHFEARQVDEEQLASCGDQPMTQSRLAHFGFNRNPILRNESGSAYVSSFLAVRYSTADSRCTSR